MDIVSVSRPGQVSATLPNTQSRGSLNANPGLIQTIQGINASQVLGGDSELTLAIDQQTRLPVIRIISRQTHQVVMQLPTEYILQLHQSLQSRPDSYQKADSGSADRDGSDRPSGHY